MKHSLRLAPGGRHTFWLAALLLLALLAWPAASLRAQALPRTFAGGFRHSLSIHADGTLWATGDNFFGQLGTGTTTSTTAWVQVGTATNWVQVAAGAFHSLGLRADGSLWAWGYNYDGELANATNNGTDNANPTPTQVAGTYTQVAAGDNHSLGLRADGTLWAWGYNYYGQLGSTINLAGYATPTPTQVAGTYMQVAAGANHSLGLRADGSLYAWGYNYYGQLGTATNTNANPGTSPANPTPTQVAGTYTQVAAGYNHSLGLRAGGSLYTWGYNYSGQLGRATNSGTPTPTPTPAQVPGTYTQATAGGDHTLALQAGGNLYTWGYNRFGELGTPTNSGTPYANYTPTQVAGTYAQVAGGGLSSLGLKADGSLYAWGYNYYGQLGTATNSGTSDPTLTPTPTGTALVTRSLAMGSNFGLAVRGDGTLWAWGSNTYGQLGIATTTASTTRPVQVGPDNDWVMVAAGQLHSLALKANGTLWAWGQNSYGQLGSATNSGTATATPTPQQVAGTYTQVAAGVYHSLGLRADGSLYAWGWNTSGQLGSTANNGTDTPNPTPTQVPGSYTRVAAGVYHSLGLRADGSLYAWGRNDYGQLGSSSGSGTLTAIPTPQQVPGTYTQVAAGVYHSLGLRADGSLYAWGFNQFGQLGTTTKTTAANPTPTPVPGTYTQMAAGTNHSLGLRADGSLYTWGTNFYGQLGNATNSGIATANPTPTQEATAGTGWTTLGAGSAASWSLVRTPSAQSFASAGQNSSGQLGDGTTINANRFDRVSPLTSLQPLPVQLTQFTAQAQGHRAVALAWATASEAGSAVFEVERSLDGVTFAKMGALAAAGTSPTAHTYALLDAALPAGANQLYYRLRQVDQDGTAHYSPVRTVSLATATAGTGLSLYPNPSPGGAATLLGAAPGAVVTVFDALGRPVATAPADAAGTAALPGGLPAGVYVVRAGQQARRLTVE